MSLQDDLLAIERDLWKNDVELYRRHTSPEALFSFAETGVIDRRTALAAIAGEVANGRRWAEADLSEVRVLEPAPNVALLLYRAKARWNTGPEVHEALCSSLYVRQDGVWILVHHQQSAV